MQSNFTFYVWDIENGIFFVTCRTIGNAKALQSVTVDQNSILTDSSVTASNGKILTGFKRNNSTQKYAKTLCWILRGD